MTKSLEDFRQYLAIDRDNLDDCLVRQPEVYYHVSEGLVLANSERDSLKLLLEEETARQDREIRDAAARKDERITETAIQNKLRTTPKVQGCQKDYAAARETADKWLALKEAFQQRSFMLRELVALFIAQRHDHAMAGGAGQAHRDLADSNRAQAGKLRTERRAVKSR